MEIVQHDVRVTTFPLPLASDWPGKSSDSQEHPAIWHMLDVAACAEHLIEGHQAFATLGPSERRACVVLVALHDVGKISSTFRALLRERRFGAYRHWQLSDVLLTHALDPIIAAAYGSDKHTRGELYAAVSGHHGGPERTNDRLELRRRSKAIGVQAERAASEWVSLLLDLLPGGSLGGLTQSVARRLSWALSGLTVASDWVASNAEWFPPASPELDPVEYLKRAQYQAAEAVRKAGLDYASSASTTDGRSLTGLTNLHPMQRAVETVEFEDGPVLVLIEDMTGSGKTEACTHSGTPPDRVGARTRTVFRFAHDGHGQRHVRPHEGCGEASIHGIALREPRTRQSRPASGFPTPCRSRRRPHTRSRLRSMACGRPPPVSACRNRGRND